MHKSLIALSILGAANVALAQQKCEPGAPATCYADDCQHCYCLGPENTIANAPVNPRTCNGDWVIDVAGFYWNAHQDGMEYAIDNHVIDSTVEEPRELNNLINAEYKTPNFEWDFGFKVGLGYNTTCDGWDIGITWTWYQGRANDHIEAERDDNHSLLSLWSSLPSFVGAPYVLDIESHWKLALDLVDIELGREYWTSKYLSIRPFIGLRFSSIKQNFDIQNKGGVSFELFTNEASVISIDLDNDFKGVGVRSGFDSTWNLGCGWALYGNLAASIVYGKFSIDHDETARAVEAPFSKTKLLETKDSFRASRGMLDLALGIQWSSMFCDCQYGFAASLGWEQHLFFHQNQLWRVTRIFDPEQMDITGGENTHNQRRGTLDTQGWTLTLQFEF